MMIDIRKIEVSQQDKERIEEVLEHSWLNIHQATVSTPHNERGMVELLKYLKLEARGRNRHHVIHRLYRKASSIRRDLEEQKLYG